MSQNPSLQLPTEAVTPPPTALPPRTCSYTIREEERNTERAPELVKQGAAELRQKSTSC